MRVTPCRYATVDPHPLAARPVDLARPARIARIARIARTAGATVDRHPLAARPVGLAFTTRIARAARTPRTARIAGTATITATVTIAVTIAAPPLVRSSIWFVHLGFHAHALPPRAPRAAPRVLRVPLRGRPHLTSDFHPTTIRLRSGPPTRHRRANAFTSYLVAEAQPEHIGTLPLLSLVGVP